VYINGYLFDVKRGNVKEARSTARGDTTSTGLYQVNRRDKQVVNFNFTAIRYSSVNLHTSGTEIATSGVTEDDEYGVFKYFPNGAEIGDDTKAWRFYGVYTDYDEQFDADSGFLTVTVAGVSTEDYKRPGDA
jgi:hypothetical protein